MTLEMQQMLTREMEDALALEDPDRRHDATLTVLAHQSAALIDCQRKTSDRVKTLVEDMAQVKSDLKPCVESDREFRKAKADAKAVKGFLGYAIPITKKIIETVGAPTAAIIFCKLTGILW